MTPEEMRDKQYERLITARNFHYENLNKWLTFFYVAIGAIFAGFCTLYKDGAPNPKLVILVMAVLYLVSICAFLSCKGYYYWENHWIILLQDFERKYFVSQEHLRVYSVFADKEKLHNPCNPIKGANVSTTKVSLFLTIMIAIISGAILIYCITKEIGCVCSGCKVYSMFVAIIESGVLTAILVFAGMYFLRSNLKNLDDLKLLN